MSTTRQRLPVRWMSIEALYYEKFSEKSDVWEKIVCLRNDVTLNFDYSDGRLVFWCTKFTPVERCHIKASLIRRFAGMSAVETDLRNPKRPQMKCEHKFADEMIGACLIPRTCWKIVVADGLQNLILRVSMCLQIRTDVFMLVCRPSWSSNIQRSLQ
jgi:hypothetical protein